MLVADPAGPLFSLQNRNGRLASTDANYVEVIHTNGGATGIGFPIGHAGLVCSFVVFELEENSGKFSCRFFPEQRQRPARMLAEFLFSRSRSLVLHRVHQLQQLLRPSL
jgi:hypothetical protein